MKPIKGMYMKRDGEDVEGTILAFLGGYAEHKDVGVFMPDVPKVDFTRLKLVPVENLFAKQP